MNARQAAGPPENDIAPLARGEGISGTAVDISNPTAPPAATQPAARWQVCTKKTSGASVKFGEYRTHTEALAIAARLREIGGNACIVEVLR